MDERRLKIWQLAEDMLWEHGSLDAGKEASYRQNPARAGNVPRCV